MTFDEMDEIEKGRKNLSKKHASKVAKIESAMALIRFELENLRPQLPAFAREHKYHDFDKDRKAWVWRTGIYPVELRKFNASPNIEKRAEALGCEIEGCKRQILQIVRDHRVLSRKRELALID